MNQSQSLAFPGNGLVAAVTVKTGMAVAWKDAGLFLKLGDTGGTVEPRNQRRRHFGIEFKAGSLSLI